MADQHADYDSKYGSYYDEHDRDDNSGVRYKAAMKKIALIVLRKLTDRQKSVYIRRYVEGKTVAEIAEEDGINISAVYRHLRKAEKNFFELKDEVFLANGMSSLLITFFKTAKDFTPDCHQIAHAYYLDALPAAEIAKKLGKSEALIFRKIHYIQEQMSWRGVSNGDLKALRNIHKEPEGSDEKLTDRQKSVYTRFYVDMKSAAEIAAEDGINISAVYRHLTKAETNIFKQSEFALLDSGIEMMFCDFKKTFMNLCPTLRRFVIDYYITGMQLQDIANKHGITRGEAKSRISDVTSYFECNGFASDDLITVGKILSQGGES